MLHRFAAEGFKSLLDVELPLTPLVVLFGPNSVGKSNLLEAMVLLSRIRTRSTFAEAFQEPLRGRPHEAFSLPETGLEGLLAQEHVNLAMEADIEPPAGTYAYGPRLRYRVGVSMRPKTGELALADERIEVLRKDGEPRQRDGVRLEVADGQLVSHHRTTQGRNRQDPLGQNHASLANRQMSGPMWPEWDVLREEFASWRSYYLDPRDAMRREQAPQEVTDIGSRGELLAPLLWSLKNTGEGRTFKAVQRALASAIPSVDGLEVELDRRRGSLDVNIIQAGTPFSSRVISEGTLRLLALCALVASPQRGGLVAFEEPENGVHPRRLDVIVNLLTTMARRGRQVVISTHSSMLAGLLAARRRELDDGMISLFSVGRHERATRLVPFEPRGQLFEDAVIRQGLSSPTEDGVIHDLLVRGWLDG